MPIYVYECEDCALTVEEFHSIVSAPSSIPCEECGKEMHRVISSTSFSLKGGGWARDGYSSYVGDAIKRGANIKGVE